MSLDGIYFLCTTNYIINYTNQPLLLPLGDWLEEKIGQIIYVTKVRNSEQMSGELHIKFFYILQIYYSFLCLLSSWMYFLYSTNLIRSQKNQLLLLALND